MNNKDAKNGKDAKDSGRRGTLLRKLTKDEAKSLIFMKGNKRYVMLDRPIKVKDDGISNNELIKWIIKHLILKKVKKGNLTKKSPSTPTKKSGERGNNPVVVTLAAGVGNLALKDLTAAREELRNINQQIQNARAALPAASAPAIPAASSSAFPRLPASSAPSQIPRLVGASPKVPQKRNDNVAPGASGTSNVSAAAAASPKKVNIHHKGKTVAVTKDVAAMGAEMKLENVNKEIEDASQQRYNNIISAQKATGKFDELLKKVKAAGKHYSTKPTKDDLIADAQEVGLVLTLGQIKEEETQRRKNEIQHLQQVIQDAHLQPTVQSTVQDELSTSGLVDSALDNIDQTLELLGDQQGNGSLSMNGKEGLSETDINQIMKAHRYFLGTIASDEVKDLKIPRTKPFGFVMNTDKRGSHGTHWIAIYGCGNPKKGSPSLEYYDSFANEPSEQFMEDAKWIGQHMKSPSLIKFKQNRIIDQSADTTNCGYFATNFLINRFNGFPFREITLYDNHLKSEKNIEKWKNKLNIEPFQHLQGAGIIDTLRTVFTGVRTDWPPSVRRWRDQHGTEKIINVTIVREPINSVIDKALNIISFGGWDKAKAKYSYDDLFHLFMILDFKGKSPYTQPTASDDGNSVDGAKPGGAEETSVVDDARLEKNQTVEMRKNNHKKYNDVLELSANISLNEFLNNAKNEYGSKLFKYDAATNNCQVFIFQMLDASGLWNKELSNFVMQDAERVLKELHPGVKKIMDTITDVADRGDALLNGSG
ncbi:hypothetical protein [Candidatus Finniella inopinata]|uniref:Ubiquitin-like protease family profile domain-containing protein n=1 Tax=Candidatus Finniella inopinata TaxID=1696036 RepID=A0A4V2DZJ7_9PROT|nr:hypothetical protein [Candidatus Finniella inopinata]RZI45297.1 hypothetical protein EQU50_07610 [Candidatus Finniella inopinata]